MEQVTHAELGNEPKQRQGIPESPNPLAAHDVEPLAIRPLGLIQGVRMPFVPKGENPLRTGHRQRSGQEHTIAFILCERPGCVDQPVDVSGQIVAGAKASIATTNPNWARSHRGNTALPAAQPQQKGIAL